MNLTQQYETLTRACGYVRLPDRTLLELTGNDRQKFLHGFCTANVNSMDNGAASEAFVLDGRGKVLGHVLLLVLEHRLIISGVGNQSDVLVPHFEQYLIREDVSINDRSDQVVSVFVCGDQADKNLLPLLNQKLEFETVTERNPGSLPCVIAHVEVAGNGYLWMTDASRYDALENLFEVHGIKPCSTDALEIVRIEHGTPWFGTEINSSNLPQEIDRNEKAISFTKGCYLGQETVARIDAIGHVNRLLRRLSAKSVNVPEIGTPIHDGDAVVGTVLSAVSNPSTGESVAMAFLKRAAADTGHKLRIADLEAVVC